jgi:hypothetical protein
MGHDVNEIKARVSLRDVMAQDGVQWRRNGASRWVGLCPLHREKTPSCHVWTGRDGHERFKCFGCGKGGDVVDYWQASRGAEWSRAVEDLAAQAGLVSGVEVTPRRVAAPAAAPAAPPLAPMEGEVRAIWDEGVAFLSGSEEEQVKIAEWRGWRRETVAQAAQAGLLGLPWYRGQRRVATVVQVPPGTAGHDAGFEAGFHALTPELKGRFRFEPTGIGSWPFVIGKVADCSALVVLEGQWDALSFYDALTNDGGAWNPAVAVMGVRGASAWRKVLEWGWDARRVQAFVFADGDEAGADWLEGDGFCGELWTRCKAVHGFTWNSVGSDGVKDFNDAHKLYGCKVSAQEWRDCLRAYYENGARSRYRGGGRGA